MKHLEAFAISLIAIFAPIKALIIITGLLIVVDLITGILSARKRGEVINSAGFRRTITKCLVYNTALLTGFLVEKYMIEGFIPLAQITAGLISVVEFKSILENLNTINGSDVFKSLVQKLGSINDLKQIVEEKVEEKKEQEPPKED